METKTVYLYDIQGYYAGLHILNERDDKTPVTHEWIVPANSTEVPMELPAKEHYWPAWNGTEWEYAEDKNNPPEPEQPETTPEEKKQQELDALDARYINDKNELLLYYVDALINDDEVEQTATKADLATLNEQYDSDYTAIVNGEE